jgi:hypothetical protein
VQAAVAELQSRKARLADMEQLLAAASREAGALAELLGRIHAAQLARV